MSLTISRRGLIGLGLGAGVLTAGGLALPQRSFASGTPAIANPFTDHELTDDHEEHLSRNPPSGGIDYAMDAGTPLPAACAGTIQISYSDDGPGNTVRVVMDNGWRSVYQHLREFHVTEGQRVEIGTILGLSGGVVGEPGAGDTDGPHLHWHLDSGSNDNRMDPLDHINTDFASGATSGGSSSGGSSTQKLPKTSAEQDGQPGTIFWKRAQKWLTVESSYRGPVDGAPGTETYKALQKALQQHGYTGPVDGSPGVNTYKAWQRLAQKYGYTGPVDGRLGVNSYRAISRFLNQDKYA